MIQALESEIAILGDKTRPDAERSIALLWVLHLVGDMHQPLHEEDNNDRGGNCVPVSFLNHKAEERPNGGYGPNLHGVWDTELVEKIGGIDRKSPAAPAEVSAFAQRLEHDDAALIRGSPMRRSIWWRGRTRRTRWRARWLTPISSRRSLPLRLRQLVRDHRRCLLQAA